MRQARMSVETTPDTEVISSPPLCGGWLIAARTIWGVIFVLMLVIYSNGLPLHIAHLYNMENGWNLNPERVEALQSIGLSVDLRTKYFITLELFTGLMFLSVGVFIFWRKSNDWVVILVSIFLITYATTELPLVGRLEHTSNLWSWLINLIQAIGEVLSLIVFYFFPNGRFVPRWTRFLAVSYAGLVLIWFLYPSLPFNMVYGDTFNKTPVSSLLIALTWHLTSIYALVYRYRYTVNPTLKQQMKWVVFGLIVAFTASAARYTIEIIVTKLALFQDPLARIIYDMILRPSQWILLTVAPICFGISILRYRLWSIDVIIRRTLVYGALTTSLLGIYMLTVGSLSVLFQTRNNILISLIGTGVVAVLFQSLREWLRHRISRLLYGERDDPNIVLSNVRKRLETTRVFDATLPSLAETIALALKLPYVAIALNSDNVQNANTSFGRQDISQLIEAAYGTPIHDVEDFCLSYQNEKIGTLIVSQRAVGESLDETDYRLLENIAHLVGTTAALQRSRQRLVTEREEERRRMSRDLHDVLGVELVGLPLVIDIIVDEMKSDPDAATTLLLELKNNVRTAIDDIRALVYKLRPQILDDQGLVIALQMLITRNQHIGLHIRLDTSPILPELPAAVEVAIYRIVSEALTNVVRHAAAHTCLIRLVANETEETTSHMILLEVTDDGRGLPSQLTPGVGLYSMRERAAELGGTCGIESLPGGGTRVKVILPCSG